jgi:hypothetical protein
MISTLSQIFKYTTFVHQYKKEEEREQKSEPLLYHFQMFGLFFAHSFIHSFINLIYIEISLLKPIEIKINLNLKLVLLSASSAFQLIYFILNFINFFTTSRVERKLLERDVLVLFFLILGDPYTAICFQQK